MTSRKQHLDPEDIARRSAKLHIWGFPYVFAQRLRLRFTLPLTPDAPRPDTSAGAALNRLGHQRRLSDPTLTSGVAPNVDTLYSLAFLDLAAGTFRLRLPDFGDRYYSIQIGEADSSTAATLGQRTHGPGYRRSSFTTGVQRRPRPMPPRRSRADRDSSWWRSEYSPTPVAPTISEQSTIYRIASNSAGPARRRTHHRSPS
ncbi:DUF1254 domain-containing protein [Nocardia flavorosea]|uniref:DUF1254 domain-containing protein n=1 Tax=Nocardia flavorosea TaxID=53429 RepID=UPI002455EC93|nr:DUF1254 domain-containing protein [Nocardia flavorosea]